MKMSGLNCLRNALAVFFLTFGALAVAAAGEISSGKGRAPASGAQSPAPLPGKKADSCDTPETKPDSCLASLSAVDKLRAGNDFAFVDVRLPAEFDRFHIAGSINIPLHLVKTKAFLKKQSVVLVNEGRTTAELERTCGELKRAGFERVAVLDGGLFGWYVSKRPLQGDPVAQVKLNNMSPAELLEMRQGYASMPGWSVIDVSTPGKYKDMRPWLPAKVTAIPLKAKGRNEAAARVSAAILQQRKRNPQLKVLVIADDNEAYGRIDEGLRKSGLAPSVLRLDGGLKSYRELVANQVAMWKQNEQPRRYGVCRG